ncbi:nuclear transport factor 2 family protein [Fusobacterium sp.]|uniref:nuclear transport factor 2 family protein n=1 Tax=Fusobacterium sp. TaxID=68766 RepID=UPI0029021016|nr:nuclear transport factor 2 family protein [Fusobacterium sp.]MDU1909917.1 nuclear transport factor 2 family protein [Fusobacterium sp.]
MSPLQKEIAISSYFNMWIERDFLLLSKLFASNIYYSECYGPEYHGLAEIYLWINAMLQKQVVLEWRIKRFIHSESTIVVEWFFKEEQNNFQHEFDGVSIIEFSNDSKIISIKEFKSKSEHITPYH